MRFLLGIGLCSLMLSSFACGKGGGGGGNSDGGTNNNLTKAKLVNIKNCSNTEEIRAFRAPVDTTNWQGDMPGWYMGSKSTVQNCNDPNLPQITVDLGSEEYTVMIMHRDPDSNVPTQCNLDNPKATNHCPLMTLGSYAGDPSSSNMPLHTFH